MCTPLNDTTGGILGSTHLVKVEQHFSPIQLISLQTHSLIHQQLLRKYTSTSDLVCRKTHKQNSTEANLLCGAILQDTVVLNIVGYCNDPVVL